MVPLDLTVADSGYSSSRLIAFCVRTDDQFPLDGTEIGRMLVMILRRERITLVRCNLFLAVSALVDSRYRNFAPRIVIVSPPSVLRLTCLVKII